MACLILSTSVNASPLAGSLAGIVQDERGIPQMGAAVVMRTAEGRVTRRVLTDANGVFSIKDVLAGQYTVEVTLDRFLPILKENVRVRPFSRTALEVTLRSVFAALQLIFPGSGQVRDMSDDWKWVLRASSSTRPVLRLRAEQEREREVVLRKLSGRFGDTRGYAEVSAGAGARQTALANETDLGTAFAVATSISAFGENNVVVSGNLGYGSTTGTPATAFRTAYSRGNGPGNPEVSVTVRQLQVPQAALRAIHGAAQEEGPRLETFTLGFHDKVALGDTARLEYGALFESVQFLNRLNYASPFGRFVYSLTPDREVYVRYASGVPQSVDTEGDPNAEALRAGVSSLGMFPRVTVRDGRPTVQRTQHVEVAYRERHGDSLVEVAVYHDTLSDTAISAFVPAGQFEQGNVLPDLFSSGATLNGGQHVSSGYRVSYARKMADRLQAAIGYGAAGVLSPTASDLQVAGISELRRSLQVRRSQIVMASVSTELPASGTSLVTTYQWTSEPAAIAPDLYNDFAARSEPGLNVIVRQPLPFSGGLPGKLEATAHFSNLLKSGYHPIRTFDGQQMYLLQAIRTYRGALSFVF